MSINYPTSLDSLPNPTNTTDLLENATLALDHDQQHSNANDAIEALEAKVGINGSAVTTSHDYKLSAVTGSAKALTSGTSTQSVTGLNLTNPTLTVGSDATGDMYYRNSSGALTRLPIGSSGQIIQVSSGGIPEYISNPSAADASTTVKGVSEIATTAEITAGTSTGSTGAVLVVPASAVGTAGASKIVQFDGTGKYPAADGSAITNIGVIASYISALTTVTASTTTNTDTTFTTNFTPKSIMIKYELNGMTAGAFRYSSGTSWYNTSGTLILNEGLFIDSPASTGTFSHTFGTTVPTSGTASGTYITVTISIQSVSSTNFVVRTAFTQSGNPTGTAKFVAIAIR